MAQQGFEGKGVAAGLETRGGVRWPPREKMDRPRQRRFHWCTKSPTNHAWVAAAPIRGPEKASCRPLAAPESRIKGVGSYPSLQQGRI